MDALCYYVVRKNVDSKDFNINEVKMNGIEKEVDNLGRIVLPVKFRKKLGINAYSKLIMSLEDESIVIRPANRHCALCGKTVEKGKYNLCGECILKIKNEE